MCCDLCISEYLNVVEGSEDVFLSWHWDGVGHSADS